MFLLDRKSKNQLEDAAPTHLAIVQHLLKNEYNPNLHHEKTQQGDNHSQASSSIEATKGENRQA